MIRPRATSQVAVIVLLLSLLRGVAAQSGPFVAGQFRGRIAYCADGNHNDPDDWVASPVALAILAEAGLAERLVHFNYNCILPQTNPDWEQIHAASVLGTAQRYGYDRARFFDCQKQRTEMLASLAQTISASSEDDPLYCIVAGPVEVPYLGIQQADPSRRPHVYCISHSRWNDGFARNYTFTHTKRSVIESGVNWVQIRDQNLLLSKSPYGRPAPPEAFADFFWLRDAPETRLRWLWERLVLSTRPDPSDAGMAYFLISGDEQCDPAKLRSLLADHQRPAPTVARGTIRLEAENFQKLSGFEVEDRNDRAASHRLCVRLTTPAGGSIRTPFREPFAAAGRCDLEVRYSAASECGLTLRVGNTFERRWRAPGSTGGWTSHRALDLELRWGDEIAVEAHGDVQLDYVQLERRP